MPEAAENCDSLASCFLLAFAMLVISSTYYSIYVVSGGTATASANIPSN